MMGRRLLRVLLPLLLLVVGATDALQSSSTAAAALPAWARTDVKDVLVQRALQTQLYYLEDLRDEPTARWLAGFLGHTHLDSKGRYTALDQRTTDERGRKRGLCLTGVEYVAALRAESPVSVQVELAPDPFTAARASRNPYLKAAVQTYEEVIEPARLAANLMVTTRCLADEFRDDLADLSGQDLESAELARRPPLLHSSWSSMWNVVVAGGEEGDGKTPLRRLNERVLVRLCTLKAAGLLLNELIDRGDQAGGGGGAAASAAASGAAEVAEMSPEAAMAAAFWFREFLDEWVPRLLLGRDDESRRRLGRAAPGGFLRRRPSDDPLADGIDADEFTELIFQEAPLVGPDDAAWFEPAALIPRLKELRSHVAQAERTELASARAYFLEQQGGGQRVEEAVERAPGSISEGGGGGGGGGEGGYSGVSGGVGSGGKLESLESLESLAAKAEATGGFESLESLAAKAEVAAAATQQPAGGFESLESLAAKAEAAARQQ